MKKFFTQLVLTALLLLSVSASAQDLFISEVADPVDYNGRFVELFNPTGADIDLSARTMYLTKQSNGGSYSNIELTGTILAGQTYIVANNDANFTTLYGFAPDQATGSISGNGDDGYFLYEGGNQSAGTLLDSYGVDGTDGTGEAWEYENSNAERVFGINAPNATWTAAEWKITAGDIADMNPGVHAPVADAEAPVWSAGYPAADNIIETGFDIVAELDEAATVFYVVLESGATAPSVEEVVAGTGAAAAVAITAGSFASGASETAETISGLTIDVAYSVYLVAEDGTPNRQDAVATFDVTPTTPPSDLYLADFESALDPFTAYSDSGDVKVWYQTSGYAKFNGYQSDTSEYDWLISPEIDLTGVTDATVEFSAYWNYGVNDDTHSLKLFYSEDYDGNTANIHTATWVEVVFPLPAKGSWTDIDPIDITAITGTAYFAFVYDYADDGNFSDWRIDNARIAGYPMEGTDATLSDLQVGGTQITGFEAAKTDYTVALAAGVTTVPIVTYMVSDENATAVLTDASDLTGDNAARTTTVVVTAQDGSTTMTYNVLFNPTIQVADIAALRAATDTDREYAITGEVVLTHKDGYRNKKYVEDASGAIEIDDYDGIITTAYVVGDGVTGLTGMLNDYYGMLQLIPTADPGAAASSGNAVEPQVVTVDEFNTNFEMYEAEFVKIEGVTFEDAAGTFDNGKNYNVVVVEDTTVFRTAFYDIISGTIPAMADIQGVAVWHYDEAKVAPRVAADLMPYSSDASLSDLTVSGTTVDGFAAGTMTYAIELEFGTTDVPAVEATETDENAEAVVTGATDLTGDETARTTTIVVTAQDGTMETYTIVFTVATTAVELNTLSRISVYPVPASNELFIEGLKSNQAISIVNITGTIVKSVKVTGDKMNIDISDLNAGIYMILSNDSIGKFVKN